MRCLKCGEIVADYCDKCPSCGAELKSLDSDIELPILKSEKKVKEDVLPAWQIKEEKLVAVNEENFDSEKNIEYRKKILKGAIIFTLIVIVIFGLIMIVVRSNSNLYNKPNLYDSKQVEDILNSYRKYQNNDDVLSLLESVKNDDENKNEVQEKTNEVFKAWLLEIDVTQKQSDFNKVLDNYQDILVKIYNQFVYTVNDNEVKMLSEEDYNSLLQNINTIRNDSEIYYTGLNLYNEHDYNMAYEKLLDISLESIFYDEALKLKLAIEEYIINIMQNDINKIEDEIRYLDYEKQKDGYLQIIYIIQAYKSVYSNVKLEENEIYRELYNKYSMYVS